MTHKPDIFLIGGPTASGKTAKALEIAATQDSVIINADAMQVYAGLPLLTAQPTKEEKRQAPHKLFEVFEPSERSSAGRWLRLARIEIKSALVAGKRPIIIGGTGMYFAALLGKLADIPEIPSVMREKAMELYDREGHDAFRALLAGRDQNSADQIELNDRQRLIRAYEVITHTGKTLGEWQKESAANSIENDCTIQKILIMPERADLYERCNARFLKMIEDGALEEVRALIKQDLDPTLPAMKILGVPELAAHLHGELSLDEAIKKAQQVTRNFAKRQMTWFRNQWA